VSPQTAARSYATLQNIQRSLFACIAALLGILVIGGVDYVSGSELRVHPLYYAPISLVAWHLGRPGALIAALLCCAAWVGSNQITVFYSFGLGVVVANTLMQGTSFAVVGLLIATLKAALMRERELSHTDPLTSLLNSRAFHEEGVRLVTLCKRKGRPVTIAYIDLDDFKAVNDGLGHQAGDDLLRRVALLIRASTRPSDISARLGGDEFAVLAVECDEAGGAELAARLADAFGSAEIAASIGLAVRKPASGLPGAVLEADACMYEAKRARYEDAAQRSA